MSFADARIIVFAKPPIPGHAKTRLIPALGEQAASELHARLVKHTLTTVTQAQLCQVDLYCADNPQHPFFVECQQNFPLTLKTQQGADLGKRMANAFNDELETCRYVILIGSDCPALTATDLEQALESLISGHDCVLKPAADGGYVLIGLKAINHSIFSDINWGTDKVLEQTRQKLRLINWRWQELDTTWDLDRPEDLANLQNARLKHLLSPDPSLATI